MSITDRQVMAELLCAEKMVECVAPTDPVIFQDPRVLDILLRTELNYVPKCNYLTNQVQPDLLPYMRKVVATWMMELCEEEGCEEQVLSTSINYLDRFLCECAIKKGQLQMIACVCLLLASKVRQCRSLPVQRLVYYTDYSVAAAQIRKFELLVLRRLDWDLSAVTAFELVDHILERLPWTWTERNRPLVRRHSRTFSDLTYTEGILFRKRPSLIASGCVLAAGRGLKVAGATVTSVCELTRCSAEDVEDAVRHIEDMIAANSKGSDPPPAAAAAKQPAAADDYQPETPPDVTDVFF